VIYINASDETMKKRLLKRALTSGRADDNEETIIQRLVTFHESTEPVIEHFRNKGKLRDIPCEGAPDEIFIEIENVINTSFLLREKLIIFVIGGPGSGKGMLTRSFHAWH
jgi:adenylate kinase family enzyme